MSDLSRPHLTSVVQRILAGAALVAGITPVPLTAYAQDTPLISGGVGFFTSTNGGNTSYLPVLSPVLAAPLGSHLLVESRATLIEDFFPKGNGQPGYTSRPFL